MRLLHTADWHLGRRLFGVDRLHEARAVLAEIRDLAERERPHAVLVAGDLLERRVVEPAALGACLEAFEGLAEIAPVMAVTGNHDDPDFWGHLAPYLAARGVHVVTRVMRPSDAVRTLDTAAGPLHVACLPWVDPSRMEVELGAAGWDVRSTYADDVGSMLDAYAAELRARRADGGGAAVLVGHLMVEGARAGGGERELTLGHTYAVASTRVPTDLDYLAFGHVHRAQAPARVAAAGRYAGSPLALDFSEDNHAKTVALAEIGSGGTAVRDLPLSAGRPLVRLRGRLDALPALAAEHPGALFLCEVELDRADVDLAREVRELVPDALRIEPRYPDAPALPAPAEGGEAPAPRSLGEHYADWYARLGHPLDPRQAEAFAAALAAAEGAA
jgi:exonuclease SbcD